MTNRTATVRERSCTKPDRFRTSAARQELSQVPPVETEERLLVGPSRKMFKREFGNAKPPFLP